MAHADSEFSFAADIKLALRQWDDEQRHPLEILRLALEELAEEEKRHSH